MLKRLFKSIVILGYILHLIFAVFFGLGQNFESNVSAALDVESEMNAMLNNLSVEIEERLLVSTGERFVANKIQEMILDISTTNNKVGMVPLELLDNNSNLSDTGIQVGLLYTNNFTKNNGRYKFLPSNTFIGDGNFDLSFTNGRFLNKFVMKSRSNYKVKVQSWEDLDKKEIFVILPEDAITLDESGNVYNQEIVVPTIEDEETFIGGDSYKFIFSVGGSEQLNFEYDDGSPAYADFYVFVDEILFEQEYPIYFSQDGVERNYLDDVGLVGYSGKKYINFQADHFTYFAIGVEEGSFLINNGDISTDTTGVVLYNNVQNISQIKFGNSTGDVLLASFEPFVDTKSWYLTTGDETKVVYAIFDDGLGNTGMISDTIVLDTDGTLSGINVEALPVLDGLTLRFDADDVDNITTGAGNLVTQWNDKSLNNYHVVQSNISSSPELQSNVIINKPALYFDGTSDYLPMSGGLSLAGVDVMSGMFVCSVFRSSANGNDNDAFLDFDRSEFWGFYYSSSETVGFDFRINGVRNHNEPTTPKVNDDKPHIACASYDNSLVNDTQIIVDGVVTLDVDNTVPGDWLGKAGSTRYGMMGDGSEATTYDGTRNNRYFNGYIGELLFYAKPVSIEDQQKIQCYLGGKWGIDIGTICTHIPVSASISYNPDVVTTRDVISMIAGSGIIALNNGGSFDYTFTGNGSFEYVIQDEFGNIETVEAIVDWITGSLATGEIGYDVNKFTESLDNDGTIGNNLILTLSGDVFDSAVSNYTVFSNMPAGLTGVVNYISGTQIEISLVGTAIDHTNIDDIGDLIINLQTGAFLQHYPYGVNGSYITGVEIDYYDPFATGGFYSSADTLLDADTEPTNGCDNGICQEANYGALNYMGASDFGSVSLIRFDLSSIPTGSVIVSASLDLTRMDIGGLKGTGFDLTQIINNSGWIEGVGSAAGAGAEQALVGEPNFKQRKRTQENWYNGDPGLVSGIDYIDLNLLDNSYFDSTLEELKKFYFNDNGIGILQNWLDVASSNQGFAFGHADKERTIIYTKEEVVSGRRPQLFINYILDIVNPQISSLSPIDNQTGVVLDTNLTIEFDERIRVVSGYNLIVKRSVDNSVFEAIDVGSTQLVVSDNIATITLFSDLENNTGYYIQIESGAFIDRANNPFTGILDTTTWNFVTLDANSVPGVTGANATGITQTTGTLGGEVVSTGSAVVTERGVYRDITDGFNPISGTKVSETGNWSDVGSFSVPVTGLPAGLRVYYRAFASNTAGVGYSLQDSFLTKPGHPVAHSATSVSNRSAVANRGFVTGADSYELYVSSDSGFISPLTNYSPKVGLVSNSYAIESIEPEITYYYRLIAKNNAGFSYASNIISFTTTYLPFPVMHLKLEETGGAVAVDSAGTHNGILDGNINFTQPGVDNNAYCFDGIDAKITTVDFSYGSDFAIQFWFKDNSNIGTEYLFSHGLDTDTNSVNVFLDGGNNNLTTQVNGQSLFIVSGQDYTDLLDGEWHMYTLVVDDNFAAGGQKKIALYLDGQQRAVDTSLSAGVYNPSPNITMGRRSIDTINTYFSGCLDDIRIYNQDLFDYEVKDMYDAFVTNLQAPYVVSTVPISGEVDVSIDQMLRIEFSKDMNYSTVESTGVVTISPNIFGINYSRDINTLLISHDDFEYSTGYTITVSTGAQDLSGTAMESQYVYNFTTQNNVYLEYLPSIFEESNQNDGSIKNTIVIKLTGDTFSDYVVGSGYVSVSNVPIGLTGVFVRDSITQISFTLTGQAINHDDIYDVSNLTVSFQDDAFIVYTATGVSRSTKSNLYIDFNDPNSMSFYPIRDTSLDTLNPGYNYGAATTHIIGDGSFVLVDFDLIGLPEGATIDSATLTFTKLNGAGANFNVGHLINNSGRVEGTKLGAIASDGESTYNQILHNQVNWYGGSAGLISGTDYDATLLIDSVSFAGNETRVFTLNSAGISVLSGRFADSNSNEGFVLYGGSDRFEIGAKDNASESFRPKLLISYTLPAEPPAIMSIGVDTGILFSQSVVTSNNLQAIEQQLSGYLRIDDPVGSDNGWYTTLSITDLSGFSNTISNSNIFIQASGSDLLSGTLNTGVTIDTGLSNYYVFSGVVSYIKRDSAINNGVKGKYGNKPWLKINIPAYQKAEDYQATITYTLYEN